MQDHKFENNPVVRPLSPADAAAYMALRREMLVDSPWAFAASPESDRGQHEDHLVRVLAGPGTIIIGAFLPQPTQAQSSLVSVAGMNTNHHPKLGHRAYIWGVYTTPSARGRGIGGMVMNAALDTARRWPGITSVGLSASEESAAAIRMYKRLGFRQWGIEPETVLVDGRAYAEVHLLKFLDGRDAD